MHRESLMGKGETFSLVVQLLLRYLWSCKKKRRKQKGVRSDEKVD